MSVKKHCDHHKIHRHKIFRRICAGLLIFAFVVLVTVLIVWAILHPRKPRFVLQDATVYAFNVSSPPNYLTSTFQVTLYSRNPNDKIGVYYDRLAVYAIYRNQQITLRSQIPPTYQGHKEVNVWSPFIYGNSVPVAPYNALQLSQDKANGAVMLTIKIDGRVRWKVGTFISGRYHIYVRCPAAINFGSAGTSGTIGIQNSGVKYQLVQSCSVSV
ncbi:hypothetical protein I3843_10G016600 [Carya illinoinensis]|uniref:Late embryogenesis abundant protein LEA-2 subgroup domain-containing protein n=1 Tax=Carya illinoinensis TaxID=32201 RepID=A0A8T1P7K2_CARIL|nr:NDR1/HIN1-like protein 1 [Carya illinoinensis]XP_042946410.1 NDR1/HIN1-like protein 1 [Carya illinoinensis]KAG2683080.1 hypothetical protein I3760_10G016400 [Carya illinoinensis]KAG2683081.1 hypothetical protein I3760_10G016400 [Carya illinoinensis]KAG2683082.1 hypothetical protein I3760_10G016400 [Carya illinoinensis]KAG6638158.1 hypothetical protein CIPAW_10G016600 [Carya illinoinensis]KAG6638159.1 hypothetical protein CIPAW_10G016600 [Carya illinoinensis]